MRFIALLFLSIIVLVSSAHAQRPVVSGSLLFKVAPYNSGDKLPTPLADRVKEVLVDRVQSDAVFNLAHEGLTIDQFPVSENATARVVFQRRKTVVDARTEFIVDEKPVNLYPTVKTYRGTIEGEPNSRVVLSYASGHIFCNIERQDGRVYSINPLNEGAQYNHLLVSSQSSKDLAGAPFKSCPVDQKMVDEMPEFAKNTNVKSDQPLNTELKEIEVLCEITKAFFDNNTLGRRNRDFTINHATALMTNAAILYEDELRLTFTVTTFILHDQTSPYRNDGRSNDSLLNEVVARWSNNTTRRRDLVHVLNIFSAQNQILGIARGIGGMCRNSGQTSAYSVSGIQRFLNLPSTQYSDDVATIAHEIGHNLGAAHTHNCNAWRPGGLDSCMTNNTANQGNITFSLETCNTGPVIRNPGSIMSYCQLSGGSVRYTFLEPVWRHIRGLVDESFTCLAASASRIEVQFPLGNRSYQSGRVIQIRWVSAGTQNVNIKFSADSGQTWTDLVRDLPANNNPRGDYGQGTWDWNVPNQATNRGLIRVESSENPTTLFSDSWVAFTIVASTDAEDSFGTQAVLNLSPNPTSGLLSCQLDMRQSDFEASAVDVIGNRLPLVPQNIASTGGGTSFELNASELPNGSYTLVVKAGTISVAKPFVVAR